MSLLFGVSHPQEHFISHTRVLILINHSKYFHTITLSQRGEKIEIPLEAFLFFPTTKTYRVNQMKTIQY